MASVCCYFQLHQPYRLRRYSVFDADTNYFDDNRNEHILQRVCEKCYLPATELMLEQVKAYDGRFRISYSLTGLVLEQLREHSPRMIALLQELAATGCVEFLSETYHHSLAFLYSRDEFAEQVDMHTALIEELFGQTPTVFRNTELTYSNELARAIAAWGRFRGVLAEGADHILGHRSANLLYHPPGTPDMRIMLRNYLLSDDLAFRFSNHHWQHYPLTADKYAKWIDQINDHDAPKTDHHPSHEHRRWDDGNVANLFIDYETFGEHQWESTGIFDFLRALPKYVLEIGGGRNDFKTPSQCIDAYPSAGEYDVPHMISWADTERDLSAWLGNAMQSNALHELYKLEPQIKEAGDEQVLKDWRRLTCSDHFYYMCTKYFADGTVHQYFNPYESPYDSYINFMNVLDNLRTRIAARTPA